MTKNVRKSQNWFANKRNVCKSQTGFVNDKRCLQISNRTHKLQGTFANLKQDSQITRNVCKSQNRTHKLQRNVCKSQTGLTCEVIPPFNTPRPLPPTPTPDLTFPSILYGSISQWQKVSYFHSYFSLKSTSRHSEFSICIYFISMLDVEWPSCSTN